MAAKWTGWTMTRGDTAEWLAAAHRRRQKVGKTSVRRLKARMDALSRQGREQDSERVSRQLHRRSISMASRLRREWRELERGARRVGAAIRRAERDRKRAERRFPEMDRLAAAASGRRERDLYFEWVSRGLGKGKSQDYKGRTTPRTAARRTPWRSAEFQDKIAYIEREDGLEDVDGAVLSNMGATQAERIGCAERIEELEPLSRVDAGVYTHVILALPHQLSPEGRVGLARELTGHLARLELPFTAALHKPDPKHDQRNFHLHVLLSLRPMVRTQTHWEFAPAKLTWLSSPVGLRMQRRIISAAFNRALAAENRPERWTHKSRAAAGLAPGGFTKYSGVSFDRGKAAPQFEAALTESEERERELQALQSALNDAGVVLDHLDTAEATLTRLEQRATAQERQRITAATAAEGEVVANSQETPDVRSSGKPVTVDEAAALLLPERAQRGEARTRSIATEPVMKVDEEDTKEPDIAIQQTSPASTATPPPATDRLTDRKRRVRSTVAFRRVDENSHKERSKRSSLPDQRADAVNRAIGQLHGSPAYQKLVGERRNFIDRIARELAGHIGLGDLHIRGHKRMTIGVRSDQALASVQATVGEKFLLRLLQVLAEQLVAVEPSYNLTWQHLHNIVSALPAGESKTQPPRQHDPGAER